MPSTSLLTQITWPFRAVWRVWIGHVEPVIAAIMTGLFMSIVYVVIFTPVRLVWLGRGFDPLRRALDPSRASYWEPVEPKPLTKADFERQW